VYALNALIQELAVVSRVRELRQNGLWSATRLPLCADPPHAKTHWDFLLEEMRWLATDFEGERKFKRMMAKKFSAVCARQVHERAEAANRERRDELREHRRRCSDIGMFTVVVFYY
jgi:E1A-binding protein p400